MAQSELQSFICDPDGDTTLILHDAAPAEEPDTNADELEDASSSESADLSSTEGEETEIEPVDDTPTIEFHIKVSSKHLMLASPVFKAMLHNDFQEGQTLRATGTLQLPLPDDDPYALTILLDIIHARTEKVPRAVSKDQILQIAILVDKYQLHELTDIYSDEWIRVLQPEVPQAWSQESLDWVCIFWVFGKEQEFKEITKIIQREAPRPISSDILPIPPAILDKINAGREQAISTVISALQELIDKYQPPNFTCGCRNRWFGCGAIFSGALTKNCHQVGLWPLSQALSIPMSVEDLFAKILTMKIRNLRELNRHTHYVRPNDDESDEHGTKRTKPNPCCCIITGSVTPATSEADEMLDGLDLDSFKS